ncbi:MAG: alpha/beta fold hydrolase [bacterium]
MNPAWLDPVEYPFAPHTLDLAAGRMHYLDEGQGPPLVMVHGTPTWSFLYRHLIRGLASRYRCVVPDHLGFGLSDKPATWSYRPRDHAEHLRQLIEHLGLRHITLVVEDFGGPIGLAYALNRPGNVDRLVLSNTWMWSLRGDPHFERFGRLAASPVGRFLYTRLNLSPRIILKLAVGRKAAFTKAIHRHYLGPFPFPRDRQGAWVLARELLGSSDWYESLWAQRATIRDMPALIAWGMRDPAFRRQELERWTALFTDRRIVELADVGHLVAEEAGPVCAAEIDRFVSAGL